MKTTVFVQLLMYISIFIIEIYIKIHIKTAVLM